MKDKIPLAIKIPFFFLGFSIICTYSTTVSSPNIWGYYFGETIYTVISFVLSIPNIAIAFAIPKLIKIFGREKLGYGNFIAQIISCVLFPISVIIAKNPYENKESARFIGALFLILVTIILSSSFFAISQTVLYAFSADFSQQTVQFYITGMSSANVILGLYYFALNQTSFKLATNLFLRYGFNVIIILVAAGAFYYVEKNKPAADVAEDDDELLPVENLKDVYYHVIKKKRFLLLLNSLLFFFVFLAYPNIMFTMKSSNPNLANNWGLILMLIFGISELGARILNSMNFKFVHKIVTKSNIWMFCIVAYIGCFIPVLMYIASKGAFYVDPVLLDVINGIFYGFLAFSLGFLGNNIAIYLYDGLTTKTELDVIGTLFSLAIVVSISIGIGVSLMVVKMT